MTINHALNDDDYGDDAKPFGDAVAAHAELERLCSEESDLAHEVARLEANLKAAADRHRRLIEIQIPEHMQRMLTEKIMLRGGVEVALKRVVRASLPGADNTERSRDGAIKWLIDSGNGAIVKNAIVIDMERGANEHTAAVAEGIRATYKIDPTVKQEVHAQTLSKLVRELLEAGAAVSKDLSVFDQNVATIKRR